VCYAQNDVKMKNQHVPFRDQGQKHVGFSFWEVVLNHGFSSKPLHHMPL